MYLHSTCMYYSHMGQSIIVFINLSCVRCQMFVVSQLSEMSSLLSALSRLEDPLNEGGVREGEAVWSALPSVSAKGSDDFSLPWLPVMCTI